MLMIIAMMTMVMRYRIGSLVPYPNRAGFQTPSQNRTDQFPGMLARQQTPKTNLKNFCFSIDSLVWAVCITHILASYQ